MNIINPMALHAADMIVLFQLPVKAFLPSAYFQFSDLTCFRENFKISINGRQTYARQSFSDPFVEQISSGMALVLAYFLKNYFSLAGHAQKLHRIAPVRFIGFLQEIISNHYYVKKNILEGSQLKTSFFNLDNWLIFRLVPRKTKLRMNQKQWLGSLCYFFPPAAKKSCLIVKIVIRLGLK
jgi:hypothetical protein